MWVTQNIKIIRINKNSFQYLSVIKTFLSLETYEKEKVHIRTKLILCENINSTNRSHSDVLDPKIPIQFSLTYPPSPILHRFVTKGGCDSTISEVAIRWSHRLTLAYFDTTRAFPLMYRLPTWVSPILFY